MVLPELTPQQRAAALEKAAAARARRAEVKSVLKSGRLSLSRFLEEAQDDKVLGRMKVRALLLSLPRVGDTTADTVLEEVGIASSRRVRGLGSQQRAELIRRFG
ncbi:integration host factor MihF [Actinomyces sp. 2119]|uniref:Integration host factor MihF n=1 Tax=Actinomyces lilanjuaniae TaxID=2321394 RepID=A0ABN5PR34_9ACTO|nr:MULTISPECIES: integration host factor, actinobacterial type [Actinomyces]AYD90848.1 integration host factor MihF [Actinomyces lilanjuaniae]RJF44738.1 integration host factor MihF [Actinomyces sp. 2119]